MPYFGGKQRIAEEIVGLFPPHTHYIEPYCGGLSVFLAKRPSRIETLNDLDESLVTFWRVLRDRPEELAVVCELTPHSRREMETARRADVEAEELEVARRVWVHLTQGRRAGVRSLTGWRFYVDAAATSTPLHSYLDGYRRRMPDTVVRLRNAQLECRDAFDVISDYGRCEESLLYIDPPYLPIWAHDPSQIDGCPFTWTEQPDGSRTVTYRAPTAYAILDEGASVPRWESPSLYIDGLARRVIERLHPQVELTPEVLDAARAAVSADVAGAKAILEDNFEGLDDARQQDLRTRRARGYYLP
jgi:site-specific DNA-adenine methylase